MSDTNSYPAHEAGFLASLAHLYEAIISEARESKPCYGEGYRGQQLTERRYNAIPTPTLGMRGSLPGIPEEPPDEEREGMPPLQYIIPPRFAQVVDGIYRAGFPNIFHLDVHEALGVKTVLSLVSTDYSWPVQHYMGRNDILLLCVPVVVNKRPCLKTTDHTVNIVMNVLMNTKTHPIVIHCNQGKHRTGCMIACFRKLQGWGHEAIVQEYREFAGHKPRPLDEAFVKAYIPRRGLRKAAKRKGIASWVAVPERLTSNGPDQRPLLVRDESETIFHMSI
ncbi:tyrosine-protein phosphatase siw14 [Penicillium canariense]|uniref:Tyrosine-protein phosphatase siw14 n=1 Tax=Penicillium canariense TaxID=189055 RepID=A0A9W9IEU6_9EURO|nr:tyrosine-protein phosphatase siw14 [Penicillium canariense]KAJ5176304.1 tyrosine-protein phosphatase siw14 [Penicillium canariense]